MLPLLLLASCAAPLPSAPEAPANVLLITLDTVRADHLGAYGLPSARTPHLDALADQGVRFAEAIAVAPVTLPSHASMLTGRYPLHHGARDNGRFRLPTDATTLAEHLQRHGYSTGAVVSARVLARRYGLDQGFATYDDNLDDGRRAERFMVEESRADHAVDRALTLLDGKLEEPWFLWLHLFDAHAPYEAPERFDALFPHAPYDAEIAWVDDQVGRLLTHLQTTGQEQRTLTTVIADHGEGLGEHGESSHGIFVYRSTTHVPWLLSGPGVEPGVIEGLVSQVDLLPTLLDHLGLPSLPGDGLSHAPLLTGGGRAASRDGVLTESVHALHTFGWAPVRAVDTGAYKLIDAPQRELYDMVRDPREEVDLLPVRPDQAAALQPVLVRLTGDDDLRALKPEPLDAETTEMLTRLGYLDAQGLRRGTELLDPKEGLAIWTALQVCQQHIRDAQHEVAIECLEALRVRDPNNPAIELALAEVLSTTGRTEAQEAALQRAIVLDPEDPRALAAFADLRLAEGAGEEGLALLEQAAAHSPLDTWAHIALARHLFHLGRREEAEARYAKALEINPYRASARLGHAIVLQALGRSEEARADLTRLDLDELTTSESWYDLGGLRAALGESSGAVAAWRRAAELNPADPAPHNNLGQFLAQSGDLEGAQQALEAALAADPQHVEARLNLANVLMMRKVDRPRVISLLEGVLATAPDQPAARTNLIRLLLAAGEHEAARVHLRYQAAHGPDKISAYTALAHLAVERGDEAKARNHLGAAAAIDPEMTRQLVAKDPVLRGLR
jgi:choline-sulfatase